MRLMRFIQSSLMIGAASLLIVGCTFTQIPEATPTLIPVTLTASPSPIPTVTLTPTLVPASATPETLIEPSATPLPPTTTPLPTSTPGPFTHEIQNNETLGYIVQLYGHRSFDVIAEVVRINDNIPNADSLPPPGNTILIPRPTIQPTATSQAGTEGGNPSSSGGGQALSVAEQAQDLLVTRHVVQEGESLVDIAQQYNTTLEIISQLNPEIGFFGCNFNIPSGGPDCTIILQIGQEVRVPAPTPTPTLSPTPSGNETATPTPTYVPPVVIFPPDNAIAQPGIISLQWVSTGILNADEVYLIQVQDMTANTGINAFITRSNAFELPSELIPRSGQAHEFQWWVTVARRNAAGRYESIGGEPEIHRFRWQSTP